MSLPYAWIPVLRPLPARAKHQEAFGCSRRDFRLADGVVSLVMGVSLTWGVRRELGRCGSTPGLVSWSRAGADGAAASTVVRDSLMWREDNSDLPLRAVKD